MSNIRKNLLFLTHVGAPGGAEYNMIDYCESPTYESTVLHFKDGPLEKILSEKNISSSVLKMPKTMENFTKDDGILTLIKTIPATLSMIRSLAKEGQKYDAVICMSQKSFILASLAKPFMRKPIIWFMNDMLSSNYFNPILIFILKHLSRFSADHIILNSQANLEIWKSQTTRIKNVHVNHPGTNVANFENNLQDTATIQEYRQKFSPNNKPLITSWKGQDIFLKALANAPNVRGVIVGGALFGEENYEQELRQLTQELNIKDRVTFAGHLNDIAKAMTACDIIVHCSTLPEPFGKVIVEGSLAGKPVIATNAGGAAEIIIHQKTGLLTPPSDINALQNAINYLLKNPEEATKIAQAGNKRVKDLYSTESMIANITPIIDNL